MLLLTFVLLGLSIVCVWIKKKDISTCAKTFQQGESTQTVHSSTARRRNAAEKFLRKYLSLPYQLPPWGICFIAAIVCGLVAEILDAIAVVSLLLTLVLASLSKNHTTPISKSILTLCSLLIALAIALHLIPGFHNPIILNAVQISNDAIPYTLRANFDKGAAGLILFAFFCRKVRTVNEIKKLFKPVVIGTFCTSIVVFGVALGIDYVHLDFKISTFIIPFIIINLFFVCVAEEAFFRGVIQERLTCLFGSHPAMKWFAVVISATLFGLAHFKGGIAFVALSTLAGFGYALTYAFTRKIESAIAIHFFVNVIHFIFFTYPALRMS